MHYEEDERDNGYSTVESGETKLTKEGVSWRPFATVTRAQISENVTGTYPKTQIKKYLHCIQQIRLTYGSTELQLLTSFLICQDYKEHGWIP